MGRYFRSTILWIRFLGRWYFWHNSQASEKHLHHNKRTIWFLFHNFNSFYFVIQEAVDFTETSSMFFIVAFLFITVCNTFLKFFKCWDNRWDGTLRLISNTIILFCKIKFSMGLFSDYQTELGRLSNTPSTVIFYIYLCRQLTSLWG